jgi:ketosteroid isomerase-like protein
VSDVETARAIYQAFGRGDVSTILTMLDDAVEWETAVPVSDVPWLQARQGNANIVGFFESLAPFKVTRFEPHTIFDGGDKEPRSSQLCVWLEVTVVRNSTR